MTFIAPSVEKIIVSLGQPRHVQQTVEIRAFCVQNVADILTLSGKTIKRELNWYEMRLGKNKNHHQTNSNIKRNIKKHGFKKGHLGARIRPLHVKLLQN